MTNWFSKSLFCLTITAFSFSTPAEAKDITLAVGLSLPPYIFKDEDKGMEFDVVKTALERKGHSLKAMYVPFGKVGQMVKEGKADGAMTMNEASGLEGHYSNSHITYQNFAISMSDNNIAIDNIADLGKYSVAAFQNATLYLGDEYKKAVAENKDYTEITMQSSQILALYRNMKKVVVSDINIFKYYQQDLSSKGKVDGSLGLSFHPIFEPTAYKVMFTDASVRDDFNAALDEMKADGTYDKIMKTYVK